MQFLFERLLAEQCAATLAGVKPGSLFCWKEEGDMPDLQCAAKQWEKCLKPYGIKLRILRICSKLKMALVYVYRPEWVTKTLRHTKVKKFLRERAYQEFSTLEEFLEQLSKRICLAEEFPHEIGLLLGYPLHDVQEFIQQKGKNYICCGCWKVYHDPETARRRFLLYQQCTERYRARLTAKKSFLPLVVTV